jgi:plastocyanin
MIYALLTIGFFGAVAAAPAEVEDRTDPGRWVEAFQGLDAEKGTSAAHGRELFPVLIGQKCARFCSARAREAVRPQMSDAVGANVKGPVKALEMLALNDDLNTVVYSDSMCTRRHAMARAAGLAAGLALSAVNQPSFAAETKMVKMGADSGQLVFVPDEIKVCAGDSVTWTNNKGGPHNVVFDEEAIPSGVDKDSISMDDQLGDEGATYTKKFDVKGTYGYYCEPHAGAGMKATLIVA